MLTRRSFHKNLAALAIASLAGGRMARASTSTPDELFLGRLTFGATPADRAEIAQMGVQEWVERQLSLPSEDDALTARLNAVRLLIEYDAGRTEDGKPWDALSEHRGLKNLETDPAELLHLLDFDAPIAFAERERPAAEVIAASLVRGVHAPAQLREVMTQFWHEHFSVNAMKNESTAIFFPSYDKVMRDNAFGNFRTLLGQVARAPTMLAYLNNDTSQASPANENYARELLELHTLGQENYYNDLYDDWKAVPGGIGGIATGYIDQDVYEVARALTGWSIGDGREIGEGTFAPETGRFTYVEGWHDPYQKRILGQEFSANSAPMQDGMRVLDILATHPATARFVTRKMLRRLGIETPSAAYHDHVAAVFHQNIDAPDQIAQTLRAIIFHDEFAATPAQKLCHPFEFLCAIYRAAGTDVSPQTDAFHWKLRQAGWSQHQVNPPTGHSDHSHDWANTATINGLVNIALESHIEWFGAANGALRKAPDDIKTFGALATYWEGRFGADAGSLKPVIDAFGEDPDSPLWDEGDDLEWASGGMIAALALTPKFMFR